MFASVNTDIKMCVQLLGSSAAECNTSSMFVLYYQRDIVLILWPNSAAELWSQQHKRSSLSLDERQKDSRPEEGVDDCTGEEQGWGGAFKRRLTLNLTSIIIVIILFQKPVHWDRRLGSVRRGSSRFKLMFILRKDEKKRL